LDKPVGEFLQLIGSKAFNLIFDFYRAHGLKLVFDELKFNAFS
jgi:hypothetical protein